MEGIVMESVWVAVGFTIFVILVWRKVGSALSSMLDALPQCNTCWNAPYCGVRPLHNYMHTGDLFGQRPNTFKCVEHMGISSAIIRRLVNDTDGSNESIFRRWVVDRPRITEG